MKNPKNNLTQNLGLKKISFPNTASFLYKIFLATKPNEKGTALGVAFGFGLLMLLLGTLAIIRSGTDKTNAQVNQYAAQAMGTAETGVTRSTNRLKLNFPYFLKLSYDPININTSKQYLGTDGNQNTLLDNSTTALNEWATPPTGSINSPCAPPTGTALGTAVLNETINTQSSYSIKAYRFRDPDGIPNNADDAGTLLVEGQKNDGSINSKARLQIGVSIGQFIPPTSFPGLYANTFVSMENNSLEPETTGQPINLICTDCTAPPALLNCVNGEPSQAYLNAAIDLGAQGVVEGDIVIGEPALPPMPPPPTAACSSSQAPPCHIIIPPMTSGGGGGGTSTPDLPRPTDIANRVTWGHSATAPYNYIFEKNSADNSFNAGTLTITTTTAPVRLYVTGNINLAGGSDSIIHTGSFEKFAIFGCTNELNAISPCISPYTDQEILLSGGASAVNVFIYALNAQVGINGGSNDPDFKAVIWASSWGTSGSAGVGSSSNNANIVVPDNASTKLASAFGTVYGEAGIPINRITAINSWERVGAN